MKLTQVHLNVLKALAKYRFLTNSQLAMLKVGSADYVGRTTHILSKTPLRKPLISVQRFPVHARFGRLEHIYSLTPHGIKVLSELGWKSERSKSPSGIYELDFFHRKGVINFDIQLDRSLGSSPCKVIHRSHYFDFEGANHRKKGGPRLTARTKVHFRDGSFFIPDTIILLTDQKNCRALFNLEFVRGGKTKRTMRQIARHVQAISEGVVVEKYGLPSHQDYVSLFLFEEPSLLARILLECRNQDAFRAYREHFLFATMTDIQRDIQNCWRKVGDNKFLFNFITGKKTFRLP